MLDQHPDVDAGMAGRKTELDQLADSPVQVFWGCTVIKDDERVGTLKKQIDKFSTKTQPVPFADDNIQPRVSLNKVGKNLVISEGRADEHDVIKPATEGSTKLRGIAFPCVCRPHDEHIERNIAEVHISYSKRIWYCTKFSCCMLNCESEITNIWQLTLPEHLELRWTSSWTPSVMFTRRLKQLFIAFPEGPVMEPKSSRSSNLSWCRTFPEWCAQFYILFHKEVANRPPHVHGRAVDRNAYFCQIREHIFSEHLDLLWALTLIFTHVSVAFFSATTLKRVTWS